MKIIQKVLIVKSAFITLVLLSSFITSAQATQSTNTSSTIQLNNTQLDIDLSSLIARYKLTGTPTSNHPLPNIESAKAQLGMKLFYSKTLGGDNTTACASCHHPMLGGGDDLSLSIGIDSKNPDVLGSDRKLTGNKHAQVPRNAPTTFNVAFWKKVLFHDARIERVGKYDIHTPDMNYPKPDALAGETLVQAQARFPITSVHEMRGEYLNDSHNQTLRRALASRLQENWLAEFRKGFAEPNGKVEDLITEQNYSEAIAEYERSQVFINNPWKAYVEGDKQALSASAKKGAWLFYTDQKDGGAGCASCHSGDFLTNEKAYNTAMPQIGSGKQSGKTGNNDYGCSLVTNKDSDKFRFRTPTLLNVEVTGPWGHDGAYISLEGITRHMLSPIESAKKYKTKQLKQKSIDLRFVKENTLEAINEGLDLKAKPNLLEQDVTNLVSFLKALTDPCVKERTCMSKWIPKADDNDPDGQMLHAIHAKTGKPL